MYRIVKKQVLNPTVTRMDIEAPLIAKKAEPGQFIILRVDEKGERIPLTVADFDREAGTVTIIFQIVGATTEKLNHLEEGDCLQDFVGPLGRPSETEGLKKVAVIGGGVAAPSPTRWRKSSTSRARRSTPLWASGTRTWSSWRRSSGRSATSLSDDRRRLLW